MNGGLTSNVDVTAVERDTLRNKRINEFVSLPSISVRTVGTISKDSRFEESSEKLEVSSTQSNQCFVDDSRVLQRIGSGRHILVGPWDMKLTLKTQNR